jgi:hypothetical protein
MLPKKKEKGTGNTEREEASRVRKEKLLLINFTWLAIRPI